MTLNPISLWKSRVGKKTARAVDLSRVVTEQRSRFNPLRDFTPDRLVRAIDAFRIGTLSDLGRILEELEQREDMIAACAEKMKASVARCKHSVKIVEGFEDDPRAKLHMETLEKFYATIRTTSAFCQNERGGFRLLVKQMMDAVHARYAVHEIVWRPMPDGTMRAEFSFVPMWMFENHTGRLRFLSTYGAYDGKDMEPGGWLVTVGSGVGIAAAVAAMGKRLSINDWLLFSEKCGTPGLHVQTDAPEGSEAYERLVEAVAAFGKDWASVTDKETVFNTVSLANGGSLPYPELVRTMNKAISVLYRGADLSTLSGEGGDATGASLQGRESDMLEQDACEMLSETLQEQVDQYVIKYTLGDDTPLAYIQIEPNTKQDAKLDMEIDKHLSELGVKLSKNETLQRYGRTEYKDGDAGDAPLGGTPQGTEGLQGLPDLAGAAMPPSMPQDASQALANEASRAAATEAWKAMRADLSAALEAAKAAIESKDTTAFINAIERIPKTADGRALAETLGAQMRDAMGLSLSNAKKRREDDDPSDPEFEGKHPRGGDGKFIKGEGVGRAAETFAYERKGRKFVMDENGDHKYAKDTNETNFKFQTDAVANKHKDTPAWDANKSVPDSGKRMISDMADDEKYTRGEEIDYGKGGAPEGAPQFRWTRGGKPVPDGEAAQMEQALRERGYSKLLQPEATQVQVRRDYANGKNQIGTGVGRTGKRIAEYDAETSRLRQIAKFAKVAEVTENYDAVFRRIAADAPTSHEAMCAYFLTRTKLRIGGGSGDNYGALDLQARHIRIDGDRISLDFDAKNSHWKQTLDDPVLAKWLGGRMKAVPEGGAVLGTGTSSSKVNAYLTDVGQQCGITPDANGRGLTAHNLRHVGATRLASQLVDGIKIDPKADEKAYVAALEDVVRQCGRHICDTGTIAFKAYITPSVLFKNAPWLLERRRFQSQLIRTANEAGIGAGDFGAAAYALDVAAEWTGDEDDDASILYTEEELADNPVLAQMAADLAAAE